MGNVFDSERDNDIDGTDLYQFIFALDEGKFTMDDLGELADAFGSY